MENPYSFHPYIADAYSAVHDWLEECPGAKGYEHINSYSQCNDKKNPFQSAAAQYRIYFPAHYFKVLRTFDTIITTANFLEWIGRNPHICLVDIGCGAGTGSIAFLETIIRLKEKKYLRDKVYIYCLGIDVNEGTLAIYNQLMAQIKKEFSFDDIEIQYNILPKSIRESVFPVIDCLKQKREQWKIPFLPRVFTIHSTVVDLLSQQHYKEQQKYKFLTQMGVSPEVIANNYPTYSREYAQAYKQILEEVAIDNLSVITIGTNKDLHPVQEMSKALNQAFASKHHTNLVLQAVLRVDYENPLGSFWRKQGRSHYFSEFPVDVTNITISSLKQDREWNSVINIENLELAWARARHNFLSESIADEVEICLFEKNLAENLQNLKDQLIAYLQEVARTNEAIAYKIPKNVSSARPRMLSRMEEEIIGTAIIQQLGQKADGLQSSFAYRLARSNGNQTTEYLYEPWFDSYYKHFLPKVRQSAREYQDGIVIKVDIKSYYMNIVQPDLIELATQELRTKSERIKWLLEVLLSRDLEEHELNRGLSQGGIGSGFWANIYLSSIDARFGSENNEWDVKYYRYADDIILLVPNPENVNQVINALEEELETLGVSLNQEKTQRFKLDDFLNYSKPDNLLDKLQKEFECLVNPLWIMNGSYRKNFRKYFEYNEGWNYLISRYKKCLESLNVYLEEDELSRKIYKYLFTKQKHFQNKRELSFTFAGLPEDDLEMVEWTCSFEIFNLDWIQEKYVVVEKLNCLVHESFVDIKQNKQRNLTVEIAERRLRFAVNKLGILGYHNVKGVLVDILCQSPWILRSKLSYVMENLARQGHHAEIKEILTYYAKQGKSNE